MCLLHFTPMLPAPCFNPDAPCFRGHRYNRRWMDAWLILGCPCASYDDRDDDDEYDEYGGGGYIGGDGGSGRGGGGGRGAYHEGYQGGFGGEIGGFLAAEAAAREEAAVCGRDDDFLAAVASTVAVDMARGGSMGMGDGRGSEEARGVPAHGARSLLGENGEGSESGGGIGDDDDDDDVHHHNHNRYNHRALKDGVGRGLALAEARAWWANRAQHDSASGGGGSSSGGDLTASGPAALLRRLSWRAWDHSGSGGRVVDCLRTLPSGERVWHPAVVTGIASRARPLPSQAAPATTGGIGSTGTGVGGIGGGGEVDGGGGGGGVEGTGGKGPFADGGWGLRYRVRFLRRRQRRRRSEKEREGDAAALAAPGICESKDGGAAEGCDSEGGSGGEVDEDGVTPERLRLRLPGDDHSDDSEGGEGNEGGDDADDGSDSLSGVRRAAARARAPRDRRGQQTGAPLPLRRMFAPPHTPNYSTSITRAHA